MRLELLRFEYWHYDSLGGFEMWDFAMRVARQYSKISRYSVEY